MFDIGLQEMLVIGVLALLVFGPSKLPDLGRMVGRAMREFRRASDEFRSTVETNLHINDPDPLPDIPATPEPVAVSTSPLPSETEPVAPESETSIAVATTAAPAEPFCAQRHSRIFHRSECAWVARIPESDRVYYKHTVDATEAGLTTCPVCEPWEPGG
jgi:TatA/E family protein of Tat protein translocase